MILEKVRRHAAITTGNFQKLFGDIELPPLPVAVARLIELCARQDAEITEYGEVIRSDTALASRVLRLVNSAAMGVRYKVADIDRAVCLLGIRRVRSLALALGACRAVPNPRSKCFDRAAFWQDSLERALAAKALSRRLCPEHEAEAFAGALLHNLALPVLLEHWSDYYEPVLLSWSSDDRNLAVIEYENFRWNHAEAGAWIARTWGLPDAMVCAVGLHHASWDQLEELGLEETPVSAGVLAALVPSVLAPSGHHVQRWSEQWRRCLGMDVEAQRELLSEVRCQLEQIGDAFGLGRLRGPAPAECLPQ